MKRELKVHDASYAAASHASIARPIPMKRELKASLCFVFPMVISYNRKAHPDEKGTERGEVDYVSWLCCNLSQGPSR